MRYTGLGVGHQNIRDWTRQLEAEIQEATNVEEDESLWEEVGEVEDEDEEPFGEQEIESDSDSGDDEDEDGASEQSEEDVLEYVKATF